MAGTCEHLDQIKDVTPRTPDGCEERLKTGDTWMHLQPRTGSARARDEVRRLSGWAA
jgi:hypothetical protein